MVGMEGIMGGAEHFVRAPGWEWYILAYFFLAGLTGGCYAIATLLRHWGGPAQLALWRLGFLVAFPTLVVCPLLLTLDLGQPVRFWHMLVDTTPGGTPITLRYWSPMSVGVWALLVYGVFATVSFLEVLVLQRVIRHPLGPRLASLLEGPGGRAFNVVGAVLGLLVASYTGVLLSVSNQPVWSDTWALGGLFLASGFSGSLALLGLLARRQGATAGESWLQPVESYVAVLELALLLVFGVTVAFAGTLGVAVRFPWLLLWLVVLVSLVPPLSALSGRRLLAAGSGQAGLAAVAVPVLVLVGVLALRMAVIFSAQL